MFEHVSVLLEETVGMVINDPSGIYVDMTLGGGGHAYALASRLEANGRLIGLDRDEAALKAASEKLSGLACKVDVVHSNYKNIKDVLKSLGINKVDGIICDLGVSSYQLDTAERGFSYQHNGILDMRMDKCDVFSAKDVVNGYSEQALGRVIREYGEERWWKRIANFIVESRKVKEITTTEELVTIIKQAIPKGARRDGPHPAKRTFQAIRIEVNGEIRDLETSLRAGIDVLKSGGRFGVISFHSLEDRVVKNLWNHLSKGCTCAPELPICVCGGRPIVRKIGKKLKSSQAELDINHRARSAILRVVEKK